eukprot:TRINITY_DN2392_c0_g3_i3.p1 TRINITY_DN2392_c0_g3~~TRINITY_DN2392_c0_g3_i3.p1  ORF type:complete len:247 (+),score=38.76 TRINITY_DN2392_c0_g3_i3:480-1220(+)
MDNEDVMELAARKGILEIFLAVFKRFYNYDIKNLIKSTFKDMLDFVFEQFLDAVKSNNCETVREMLNVHPRLKVQLNHDGSNALHEATRKGHMEMVKLLLEYRKDYDAYYHYREVQNRAGETALHIAVKENHIECVKILIDGCRIRLLGIKTKRGWTSKHFSKGPEMDNALISRQAELGEAMVDTNFVWRGIHAINNPSKKDLLPCLMEQPRVLEEHIMANGSEGTMLHYAVEFCDRKCVEFVEVC